MRTRFAVLLRRFADRLDLPTMTISGNRIGNYAQGVQWTGNTGITFTCNTFSE
jgi:hypothetical protein